MIKKALDVTTKGWSKEDIADLEKVINDKNFRWIGKAINIEGKIKWFHAFTKVDVEIFAIQEGYKILGITKKIEIH